MEVFPTFLRLQEKAQNQEIAIKFALQGPMRDFVVFMDLQKGKIQVQGFSRAGFFRYVVYVKEQSIHIDFIKKPKNFTYHITANFAVEIEETEKGIRAFSQDIKTYALEDTYEKLFLGCSKKQDIDKIRKRENMQEVFPLWYAMGKYFPKTSMPSAKIQTLFANWEKAIDTRSKELLSTLFVSLFRVGFTSLLLPRLVDTEHQGIIENEEKYPEQYPHFVIHEGARLIRRLFFQKEKEQIFILPCLPIELHTGKFINIQEDVITLHIEWSKKQIKKILCKAKQDCILQWHLPSSIKSFRLRFAKNNKGKILKNSSKIPMQKGVTYCLDRFTK